MVQGHHDVIFNIYDHNITYLVYDHNIIHLTWVKVMCHPLPDSSKAIL